MGQIDALFLIIHLFFLKKEVIKSGSIILYDCRILTLYTKKKQNNFWYLILYCIKTNIRQILHDLTTMWVLLPLSNQKFFKYGSMVSTLGFTLLYTDVWHNLTIITRGLITFWLHYI